MMVKILRITNDLSITLQRCDQDLLNALSLVNDTKIQLQEMRNEGREELIFKVAEICNKHDIDMPIMDASYVQGKKPRRHMFQLLVFLIICIIVRMIVCLAF